MVTVYPIVVASHKAISSLCLCPGRKLIFKIVAISDFCKKARIVEYNTISDKDCTMIAWQYWSPRLKPFRTVVLGCSVEMEKRKTNAAGVERIRERTAAAVRSIWRWRRRRRRR